MEEIEVPVEKIQEEIHERAQEELHHGHAHSPFSARVALSSAILAVFAAISALLAGHHSNEALIDQIRASDHWGYYQAKGIKSAVLSAQSETLRALGHTPPSGAEDKVAEYKKEQEDISEQAREEEGSSAHHLAVHQVLARAVTFFQIAITIAAIAVLTHRKPFWYVSLAFGGIGLWSFVQGLMMH